MTESEKRMVGVRLHHDLERAVGHVRQVRDDEYGGVEMRVAPIDIERLRKAIAVSVRDEEVVMIVEGRLAEIADAYWLMEGDDA